MQEEILNLLHPKVQQLIAQLDWDEFSPVQERLIPAYLQTQANIAASAPTGSGKTEAAAAPAFSEFLSNPVPGFGILWLSPLRALINDGYARLQPLAAKLDIAVHRWHSDVSSSAKAKTRRAPDGLLQTTPESLEAHLILHPGWVRESFAHLQVIVIDELHSLLDTERGQHVLSLLSRLFHLIERRPRLVGLSATLGDFVSARRFLEPDSPDSVVVIDCQQDDHEIRVTVVGRLMPSVSVAERGKFITLNPAQARELADFLAPGALQSQPSGDVQLPMVDKEHLPDAYAHILRDIMHVAQEASNLVFFNRRALLEYFADRLHQLVKEYGLPEDPFYHHHSSLSKEVRERAETVLKIALFVTVLATSSLELGIDMQSVFHVLQILAPATVSSLKQRLGRSGRMEGQPRRLRLYTLDDSPNEASDITDFLFTELLRGIGGVELMLRNQLEPSPEPRLHLSTALHQVMALLRQEGPLFSDDLYTRLCVRGAFRKVDQNIFEQLLHCMHQRDLITHSAEGLMVLGLLGEKVAGSHEFFAVFSTEVEFEVLHQGRPIGKLPITWSQREGSEVTLDGKRWIIERINRRARRMTVVPSDRAGETVFLGRGPDIHDLVVGEMREVLRSNGMPPYLDPETVDLLKAARIGASKAGLLERSVLVLPGGIYWFPWVGTKALLTLRLAARSEDLKNRPDAVALYYPSLPVDRFVCHLKRIASGELDPRKLAALLPEKKFERYDQFLTDDLLITSVAADRLNLPSAQRAATAALQELDGPHSQASSK